MTFQTRVEILFWTDFEIIVKIEAIARRDFFRRRRLFDRQNIKVCFISLINIILETGYESTSFGEIGVSKVAFN